MQKEEYLNGRDVAPSRGTLLNVGMGQSTERETAATEILRFAERLSGIASDINQRTHNKLQTVMVPEVPTTENPNKAQISRAKSPLFEALSQSLASIEQSLAEINDCLDRTEL